MGRGILFPERCVVCGDFLPLTGGAFDAPVCHGCVDGLERLEGKLCTRCSQPLISELDICLACRDREFEFESNCSIWNYRGTVRRLIIAYKVSNEQRLRRLFAREAAEMYHRLYHGLPLVPVPARKASLRRRGWDHVERICSLLAMEHEIEIVPLLKRTGIVEQKGLSREERRKNIRGTIISDISNEVPREAVVFDDVFTTGATANECACVLKAAGVHRVYVLTLARD
jgi:competence protein ComFC